MAGYSITITRAASKELERLPSSVALRISAQIKLLTENPRPAHAIKLHGGKDAWRMRVGDYRVVYNINDSARVVDIFTIRHRKDVYRDL